MKTLIVDFSKRCEKNRIILEREKLSGLKQNDIVRLTDNDIAVRGLIVKNKGKMCALINWDYTEYKLER